MPVRMADVIGVGFAGKAGKRLPVAAKNKARGRFYFLIESTGKEATHENRR